MSLLIIIAVFALCIYVCAKAGSLSVLFISIFSGMVFTSAFTVVIILLAEKLLPSGISSGNFITLDSTTNVIKFLAIVTLIYSIPFAVAINTLLTTVVVFFDFSFTQVVIAGIILSLIIGFKFLIWSGGGSWTPFFIAATITLITAINNLLIASIKTWLQR